MTNYEQLLERIREAALLESTSEILTWDQETMMPPRGLEYRSRQLAQLARLSHEMATAPEIGDLLGEAESDASLDDGQKANVREIRRKYDKRVKVPAALVAEIAEVSSKAHAVWVKARQDSDFESFRPSLERLFELELQVAECIGVPDGGEPWDALADDYEAGLRAREIEPVFTSLRERLTSLLDKLLGGTPPDTAFRSVAVPIPDQKRLMRMVAGKLGFDFERGRLDVSTHPFTGGSHCNDVRITTRYNETDLLDALGGTVHETGHGLYEQGLPEAHIGTPLGEPVSFGIHESQSRLWENQVGRSRGFWKWLHPELPGYFGDAVAGFDLDTMYAAANAVEPSLIRVDADEATYNLHIMVRFELELAMFRRDLAIADVPDAWNQKMRDYLGIEVPDDRQGCLQDVHWSFGGFGYFPTYSLGNLYAAQFYETALAEIGDLEDQFAAGEFGALRQWLGEKIHRHGSRYRAGELCERVTGRPLDADALLRHLESKLTPIYQVG